MKTLKVLVTGGTGFIGSHLVDELVKNNLRVRVFLRTPKKSKGLSEKNVEIFEGNLLEFTSIEKGTREVDIVFHLASVINLGNVPDYYYCKVNVKGTKNLVEACIKGRVKKLFSPVRLMFIRQFRWDQLTEDSPYALNEILGKTKLEAENIIKKLCENSELSFINLRISRVYGPGDFSLLKLFKQINSRLFFMIGNGKGLIQPIFIKDVVDALVLSARKEDVRNETIIIAENEVLTKKEFCDKIAKILDKKILSFSIPSFIALPPIYLMEKFFVLFGKDPVLSRRRARFFLTSQSFRIDKAIKILGFEPKVKLEEGLRLTVQWYKENNFLH